MSALLAEALHTGALLSPDQVRKQVRELPALPRVVTELQRAIDSDGASLGDVIAKLSSEQALVAKVMRLANSSFYGLPGRVGSIGDAVNVLGLRLLGTLVTAAALASRFERPGCAGFDIEAFRGHSLATAVCARELALATRADESSAFLAGLLHDIGRLALASHYPTQYTQVLAWQARHDALPAAAEQAVLGLCHAEVGGLIAQHWHFPVAVVEAIRWHHEPGEHAGLIDLVHAADAIVHALDLSGRPDEAVPPLALPSWDRLALDAQIVAHVMERTAEQALQLAEAMKF